MSKQLITSPEMCIEVYCSRCAEAFSLDGTREGCTKTTCAFYHFRPTGKYRDQIEKAYPKTEYNAKAYAHAKGRIYGKSELKSGN